MNGEFTSDLLSLPALPEEVSDYLYELGFSDGLPVIPPTSDRVRSFIDVLGRDPAEVVAVIPPQKGIATVEKIAINSVLAGCKPSYFPVVVAAIEAFSQPEFNGRMALITNNPSWPLLIINGPIRDEIAVGYGANCMALGSRANLAISRAVRFTLLNVREKSSNVEGLACQGYPGRVSFCFGENEAESPWEPLHVERNFARGDSTVTVVLAHGTSNILVLEQSASNIMTALAHGMINAGANNFTFAAGEPLLAINPGHARKLAEAGIGKAELREYLFQHARVPLDWYPSRTFEIASLEERAIGGSVPIASSPDEIMVVVCGKPGSHSTFIPTYANTVAVTRLIEPVARASQTVRPISPP